MSQEEQEQQKNFRMQIFFDKGFTLTGVWHWRPSLVTYIDHIYDQIRHSIVAIVAIFMENKGKLWLTDKNYMIPWLILSKFDKKLF